MEAWLRPGAVIVLEGLDGAGKSTQVERLKARVHPESALFAHMPTGFTAFSELLYGATESRYGLKPKAGVALQFAHLACHAENMPFMVSALSERALILDRWWWSTVAYGWYGGPMQEAGMALAQVRALVDVVWHAITPSVIFIFENALKPDENNVPGVAEGYRILAAACPDVAVTIPAGEAGDVTEFILDELSRRALIQARQVGGGGSR